MTAIPLLVLSDAPGEPTGLARIARDLTSRLHAEREALNIRVAQLGWGWSGPSQPWPVYPITDQDNWGHGDLEKAWRWHADDEAGVLFTVWDPARVFATSHIRLPIQRWGYFAVDSHNCHRGISGPAGEALTCYHRVLAYTRWGSRILKSCRADAVPYLPHGLDLSVFRPQANADVLERVGRLLHPTVNARSTLLGCVATNQPRKDLALLFSAVALLRRENVRIRLWFHTDRPIWKAWSVPQLASDFGLDDALVVTTSLSDEELAAMYALCACTIAPGLGEGFGYPIVESLACGTPVVHGTFGGGAELVPRSEWRFPERMHRYESVYALVRPVYDAQDVANAVNRALAWRREEPDVVREFCRGSVAHLDWDALWPRWRSWFKKGLDQL